MRRNALFCYRDIFFTREFSAGREAAHRTKKLNRVKVIRRNECMHFFYDSAVVHALFESNFVPPMS